MRPVVVIFAFFMIVSLTILLCAAMVISWPLRLANSIFNGVLAGISSLIAWTEGLL